MPCKRFCMGYRCSDAGEPQPLPHQLCLSWNAQSKRRHANTHYKWPAINTICLEAERITLSKINGRLSSQGVAWSCRQRGANCGGNPRGEPPLV